MIEPEIRIQTPIRSGGRFVVPVVRENGFSGSCGTTGFVDPVALLFEEAGCWYFVPLLPGFSQKELESAFAVVGFEQKRSTTPEKNPTLVRK
ncbi:MAG: hypothetical protein WAK75_06020 [Methanoregula sp.]|uniref:hypothetical protein n=2 Tax=Methanoregula sp. TaxID=2052170 RepID=UPI003BB01794